MPEHGPVHREAETKRSIDNVQGSDKKEFLWKNVEFRICKYIYNIRSYNDFIM
jgi:hypothetical protein